MRYAIGFIGFGEASFHIARGLAGEGLRPMAAYDKYWKTEPAASLIRQRAQEAGVILVSNMAELIQESDIVVCSTSATLALSVAEEAAPYLNAGQIYADINSAGPETKRAIDAVIGSRASFIDVAVMESVPANGHKVAMLLAGKDAQRFLDAMAPYGMQMSIQPGAPGQAAAAKMCRSIFMKGINAVLFETVAASEKYGLLDDVLASITHSLNARPIPVIFNGLLGGGAVHAERRGHEMEEVVNTLKTAGIEHSMSEASAKKLAWVASLGFKERFNGVAPKDFHALFPALHTPPSVEAR